MDPSNINNIVMRLKSYENRSLQEKALQLVPKERIASQTSERLNQIKKMIKCSDVEVDETIEYEKIFLEEFTMWFKTDFFKWFETPQCQKCERQFKLRGMQRIRDVREGLLDVEVYICESCFSRFEFPRHFNPLILLKTRVGRCSEWAQCFTLMCMALGWEARFVEDVTDHVWTEIYSHFQKRWIHIDPCEGVVDQPLIYELGWNKKLSYIIAFSPSDVQDVTWRYSTNHRAILERRSRDRDSQLLDIILTKRNKLQSSMSKTKRKFLNLRLARELGELMCEPTSNGTFQGRTSGSEEWRRMRNEIGNNTKHGFVWNPTPTEFSIFNLGTREPTKKTKKKKKEREKQPIISDQDTDYMTKQVANKSVKIMFNSSSNAYLRDGAKLSDWETYTFATLGVFRKVELDWKKSYLARNENSEEGVISWRINVSECKMLVDKVDIKCPILAVEGGLVCWAISKVPINPIGDSTLIGRTICDKGASFHKSEGDVIPPILQKHISSIAPTSTTTLHFNAPTLTVSLNEDVNDIVISVALLKGNQWQHAQIFRQDLSDKGFDNGFIVYLK